MSKIEDGGPAFPYVAGDDWQEIAPGITVRDYFAAKAMQGIMARVGAHEAALIAHDSFIVADAMLAARKGAEK